METKLEIGRTGQVWGRVRVAVGNQFGEKPLFQWDFSDYGGQSSRCRLLPERVDRWPPVDTLYFPKPCPFKKIVNILTSSPPSPFKKKKWSYSKHFEFLPKAEHEWNGPSQGEGEGIHGHHDWPYKRHESQGLSRCSWRHSNPFLLPCAPISAPLAKVFLFSPAGWLHQQKEVLPSKESRLGLAKFHHHLQRATLWLKFPDGCLWGRRLTVGRKLLALKNITGILL